MVMLDKFREFTNKTEMTSLAGLVGQVGWLAAILSFTFAACYLLLGDETQRGYGVQAMVAIFGALTAKSGINAASHHGNRKTAAEYAPVAQAKAKGETLARIEAANGTNTDPK